jgi:hypothetical protein
MQSIFSSPARLYDFPPSLTPVGRAAELKILCIMCYEAEPQIGGHE